MPSVKFVYSPMYDKVAQEWRTGMRDFNQKVFDDISKEVYDDDRIKLHEYRAADLQKRWEKIGKRVFLAMAKVSGCVWKDKQIVCYVMDFQPSFSDPMTICIKKNPYLNLECTMHELGHRLLSQNRKKLKWNEYKKEFKREREGVRNHILLHAILKLTYLEVFGETETEKYMQRYKTSPEDYHRAWELVDRYGAEKLIQKYIK